MGVSYFVSTYGSAETHEKKNVANYENYFWNFSDKEITRPSTRHNFHEALLLIDEYRRMRQTILGIVAN